jgi:hypothetical protein
MDLTKKREIVRFLAPQGQCFLDSQNPEVVLGKRALGKEKKVTA